MVKSEMLYIVLPLCGAFLVAVFVFFLMSINNDVKMVLNKLDELEETKPFSSERWAQEKIKEWYGGRGVDFGRIVGNYRSEHVVAEPAWAYYNEYKDRYWNITVWFLPENLFLAECKIFDITAEVYCQPTQQGIDLIAKYNK